MKKVLLLSLLLVCTVAIQAQTADKKWGVGFGAGVYGITSESNTGIMPELYFSRYLSNRFDVLLKGNLGLYNSKITSNLDMFNGFLNLRLKLANETQKFRPYLFAGPGFLADNADAGVNFDAGLGSKLYFSQATALYIEAGYIHGIETTIATKSVHDNFWKATIGFEFSVGKTVDTDKDGVPDKRDKCPNTPTGVAVDANGCPLDSDGDGVADFLDDCPTVVGLTSLKGCPDADGDGVADKNDNCPNTPKGIKVDEKGCPLDSDGDGIADNEDKCPNTPKGIKVDAKGCPVDTDGDGIPDSVDKCPTVAGSKDNNGCPVKEAENKEVKKEITPDQVIIQNIKVTPVHFVSNHSYLTDYSKGNLNKLIVTLKSDKAFKVNIFGYADAQGTDEYNIKLSQTRIESVIKYLEEKGIAPDRIIHQKAFGKANPVATNDTEEGRLKNRRVEFEIFKMK